jgi:hypothetical protein
MPISQQCVLSVLRITMCENSGVLLGLQVGLTPGDITVGMGDDGPGCFAPKPDQHINKGQAFGWETIMTVGPYMP